MTRYTFTLISKTKHKKHKIFKNNFNTKAKVLTPLYHKKDDVIVIQENGECIANTCNLKDNLNPVYY